MKAAIAPTGVRTTPASVPSDKRRHRRIKVFIPTQIVIDDATVRAHLLDVSAVGSRLHLGGKLDIGAEIRLLLDGETLSANVIWVSAGRFGIEFRNPLSPLQITALVAS